MFDLAAGAGVPLVLMHMQGQPRHMQDSPAYRDVVREVLDFLSERAAAARAAGVRQLIVDPGIGFGKTTGHNLQLLAAIDRFRGLGWPVLVGHSRKNFIGQVLASPGASGLAEPRPVDGRLAGGLGVAVWCALQGAAIIRTHDVAETCDALTLVAAIQAQRGEAVHV
jgi:dihydropteroate synthase